MKSLLAFIRKEWTEHLRSGRVLILGILFVFFGIMGPAVAMLTPRLYEMLADSYAGAGIVFTSVTVTALDSWVQFFKNLPIALIVFILLESSVFTREYRSGTLLLSLTKGLERWKIVVAKALVPALLWTACYWLCFGVTYGYTGYFWDNAVAQNLLFSAFCWWLFGLWAVLLMVFFSTVSESNTGVLAGTGGIILVCVLLGVLPWVSKYLPTLLMDGNSLIYGMEKPGTYILSLVITAVTAAVCFIVSIPVFNRKQL